MAIKTAIYLLPTDELTLTDQRTFRQQCQIAGEKMARDRIGTGGEYIARPFQNVADFGCALDQWNTAPLAVINVLYSVFQAIAAPAVGLRQVFVFFKVGVETAGLPVSQLLLQEGVAARTTFAVIDLEQVYAKNQTEGYFSEPVVYAPGSVMNIRVMCRIVTGAFARVQLGGFVIEPTGPQISG